MQRLVPMAVGCWFPRPPHRADDLRTKFERYGEVRDIYLPKDYYSGCERQRGGCDQVEQL